LHGKEVEIKNPILLSGGVIELFAAKKSD
jgi:hypothetical protein